MHVHKLKSFVHGNLRYTKSLVIGCDFKQCQLSTDNSEFWYCTFEDSYINLDEFTELWEEIWCNDLEKLAKFLAEFETKGSGLWLVSTVREIVTSVTGGQLKQLRMWEPLFSTCEGTLNGTHLRYLINVVSDVLIERLVTVERDNYLRDADDDYDYDDDCNDGDE